MAFFKYQLNRKTTASLIKYSHVITESSRAPLNSHSGALTEICVSFNFQRLSSALGQCSFKKLENNVSYTKQLWGKSGLPKLILQIR
jgi:hypothetical protein